MTTKETTKKNIAYLYLFITFSAWGSLYVVSKFVLGKVPIFTVSFLRYIISGTILYLIIKAKNYKKIERQDYKYIIIISFIGYFVSMSLQLIGTKLSNASLASLVNSMSPVAIMVFAAIILKEKLTVKKITSIILSVIGVYVVIGGVNGSGQIIGIIISVFAVTSWSYASVIIRLITQKYEPIQITTYCILTGAIFTFPFSFYELVTTQVQFDLSVILSLLYMGIVCTAIAHVLWNKSLSMIEAGTCSLFYPLQPMISVLLGSIFLEEKIGINFIFGAILIVSGVLISVMSKKIHSN